MTGIPLWQVDAFTGSAFRGNAAAVCLLETSPGDDWMQKVAAEMNLSETAFVRKLDSQFDLRWFTPAVEVKLFGHATLASAHALWTEGIHPRTQPIHFATKSGVLTCRRRDGDWIEMDFPAASPQACNPPAGLLEALGLRRAVEVANSRMDYMVVIEDPEQLRSLSPDFRALGQVETRGVIVTCRSNIPDFDFLSRFFAPSAGIDEDPVTGSAHCVLGPYWGRMLGKQSMVGLQQSKRSGTVGVEVRNDRVLLSGQAVTVLSGKLLA